MDKIGIYVHVPLCAQKCPYCDFYSVCGKDNLSSSYIDAVLNQLDAFAEILGRRAAADTIYFGGGTPSRLEERDAGRVTDAAARCFNLDPNSEITLELNPETSSIAKLKALKSAGINRLSLGVQSINDKTLGTLGRKHTAAQAVTAIEDAAGAGFTNISADIMLALPGENQRGLEKTLTGLCALPITHMSAYLLKLMDGTPFGDAPPEGIPSDDEQARFYQYCCDHLSREGFEQYEISNFAQPGYHSRHNLKYWNCDEYIGLGPSAHSFINKKRYSFPPDLDAFLEEFGGAKKRPIDEILTLEGDDCAEDYIMLRLRTTHGLNLSKLNELYSYELSRAQLDKINMYAEKGLLTHGGDTVALTARGMLVSNSIISGII